MPQLKVLGGGREVGSACLQLDINRHHFLLDCGIDPAAKGRAALPDMTGVRIDQLDAVFVSHAHLDHTGGIPDLVRHGFRGKVYMTLPTLALLNLLWQDELSIMEREWPKEERLWSSKEMHQVLMKMVIPTTYHEVFSLNSLKVNFHNAGHILGSTMTEFIHNDFRLVFSGDIGTSSNHLRYWRTEDMANPNVLICEGTYGGKNRKGRSEVEKEFLENIRITLEEGGKVLIPMFAVGKTQELLKILKDGRGKYPSVDVYLEGMSIDTLRVYEQFLIYMDDKVRRAFLFNNINPFRWEALRLFRSVSERKHIHQRDNPCIIMAPSGMLRGGWSVWHLIKMAPSKKNMVAVCGHMEEGTTGYDLINGKREFQLTDMLTKSPVNVNVQCKVDHFDLSAHAMHNELCNFISQMKPEKLVLIHGDEASLRSLAESVKPYACQILIPSNGDRIDLEYPMKAAETPEDVEIPLTTNTSLVFPKDFCMKVKHMGKDRFMKAQDLRAAVRGQS